MIGWGSRRLKNWGFLTTGVSITNDSKSGAFVTVSNRIHDSARQQLI